MFFVYVDLVACIFDRPKAVVQHSSEFMQFLPFLHFENSEQLLPIHKCGTAIMVLPCDISTIAALFYFMPIVKEYFLVHIGPASANYPLGMYTDTKSSKRKRSTVSKKNTVSKNSVFEAIQKLVDLDDMKKIDKNLIDRNKKYTKRLKKLRQECKKKNAIEEFQKYLQNLQKVNHNLHVPHSENENALAIYFHVIGKYSSGWVTRVNEKTIGGDTGGLLIPVERVIEDSDSSISSESSSEQAKKKKFDSGTGA